MSFHKPTKSLGCPRRHSDLRRSARCGRPINQWNNGAAVDRPGEKLPIVYLGRKEDDRSDAIEIRRHIDCVWSDLLLNSRDEKITKIERKYIRLAAFLGEEQNILMKIPGAPRMSSLFFTFTTQR